MKYFRKLQTYWFILNHILEITDALALRLDALEYGASCQIPKKRKSTKKPKEKK